MRYWYVSDPFRGERTYTSVEIENLDTLKAAIIEIERLGLDDDEKWLTEPVSIQLNVKVRK